jgi:hypothetical protein
MAKRSSTGRRQQTAENKKPAAASPAQAPDAVQDRVVAFAEQLGRVAGTVQAKAEGWMDQRSGIRFRACATVPRNCSNT